MKLETVEDIREYVKTHSNMVSQIWDEELEYEKEFNLEDFIEILNAYLISNPC